MTQFAPVGPLQGLRSLKESHLLGDYHLLIAPIVLKLDWQYANFFNKENPGKFIILDNGVIEQGVSSDLRALATAAAIVNADVVVMPDTIDDGSMTVKQVENALYYWHKNSDVTGRFQTMGVVQGKSWEECIECARKLVEAGVDWLAVPRGLTVHLKSRVPLVQHLASEHGLPMHVLGHSDNMYDDIQAAVASPLVRGIDAATPMWAEKWLPIKPPTDEPNEIGLGARPKNFWAKAPSESAGHNVETIRRWIADAHRNLSESTGVMTALGSREEPADHPGQ